jgi:hypothetical protein
VRANRVRVSDAAIAWVKNCAGQKPKELGYAQELWTYGLLTARLRQQARAAGYPGTGAGEPLQAARRGAASARPVGPTTVGVRERQVRVPTRRFHWGNGGPDGTHRERRVPGPICLIPRWLPVHFRLSRKTRSDMGHSEPAGDDATGVSPARSLLGTTAVRQSQRQRRPMASLAESGQQTPIVVVLCPRSASATWSSMGTSGLRCWSNWAETRPRPRCGR